MRLVLIGDGESPHLAKWARALSAVEDIELWAASSRGFDPEVQSLLATERRLALRTAPDAGGGNFAVLQHLPRLARWLRGVRPDWLHAHYLTSHGTLAWAARRFFAVPGRLVGSAWGSDILVTPERSAAARWLTRRVLRACALTTSDSQVMAARMRELGAGEVMVFPFGLEAMPEPPAQKDGDLVFANRGLEDIYDPQRVLEVFAAMRSVRPALRLAVANDGSLRGAMQSHAAHLGLGNAVQWLGRLDAPTQSGWYGKAQWYLSLPRSDSVSVSVLEAMAHGCIPVLSDLPANRELVRDGVNGLLLCGSAVPGAEHLRTLAERARHIGSQNRTWVQQHALFAPAVQAFVGRLRAIAAAA